MKPPRFKHNTKAAPVPYLPPAVANPKPSRKGPSAHIKPPMPQMPPKGMPDMSGGM